MHGRGDIENFLKKRLDNLENQFQDDWAVFERKLEKALYLRRLQRMIWMGTFSLVLLGIFAGVNVYQIWGGDLYEPREHPVLFEESRKASQSRIRQSQTLSHQPSPVEGEIMKTALFSGKTTRSREETGQANPSEAQVLSEARGSGTVQKISKRQAPSGSVPQVLKSSGTNTVAMESTGPARTVRHQEFREETEEQAVDPVLSSSGPAKTLEDLAEARIDRIPIDIPVKNVLAPARQPGLKYTLEEGWNVLARSPEALLRAPIEAVDIHTDYGPYVSPLQEKNPWSYSINVYPNFTFRKFKVDEDKFNMLHRDFVDAVQAAESGGFSLNVGFEISKRIGQITYLNSGIEYISYKTDVAYNFTNFRDANINSTTGEIENYVLKESSEQIRFSDINIYHYLNFPLSVSYQPWASDHIRLNIEMGGSFLYFVTARGKTLNYKTLDIIDLSERDYKNYIGSFCFKVGANYYVSQRINVGFEPTLMYFTNTIYTNDYPFYVIPYSVGVNLNLQVKLN